MPSCADHADCVARVCVIRGHPIRDAKVCAPRNGDRVLGVLCEHCGQTTCLRACPGAPDLPARNFWLALSAYEDAMFDAASSVVHGPSRDAALAALAALEEAVGVRLHCPDLL